MIIKTATVAMLLQNEYCIKMYVPIKTWKSFFQDKKQTQTTMISMLCMKEKLQIQTKRSKGERLQKVQYKEMMKEKKTK